MAENVYRECFPIEGRNFKGAGEVSSKIRTLLKEIGVAAEIVRRAAIVSYEAEMNCTMYADRGEFRFTVTPDAIFLSLEDEGPGIADTGLAMEEGYSTAPEEYREMGFGAGMGLPNMNRHSDEFRLTSAVGHGTRVESVIRLTPDEDGDDDAEGRSQGG